MIDYLGGVGKVHFFGGSSTFAPWQNCAWIVELKSKDVSVIQTRIMDIRAEYKQDSAFVMISEGLFL